MEKVALYFFLGRQFTETYEEECYKIKDHHSMLNIGGWGWVQGIFLD